MSSYVGGFQVLLTSQVASDGTQTGVSVATFDNLVSDLAINSGDLYEVSHTPLALDETEYDDALPNDVLDGNAVYFTASAPTSSLTRVGVDGTWVQLDGHTSYNAALVSYAGIWHTTIYTGLDCPTFSSQAPPGATVDRYVFNALVANGPGQNYLWNPSPASVSGDCGFGAGVAIWAVQPYSAPGGAEVTLVGYGFGESPGTLSVGGVIVSPESWSNDRISFVIPIELAGGRQVIEVLTSSGSATTEFLLTPNLVSVFPQEATSGITLTLLGTGFGDLFDQTDVYVDGSLANIMSKTDSKIEFTIPKFASPGPVSVVAVVNDSASNESQVNVLPFITTLSISLVNETPVLTVAGSNFGAPTAEGLFGVLLDGEVLTIKAWQSDAVKALLPSELSNGDHSVTVIAASQVSNAKWFSFTRNQVNSGYLSSATSPGDSWKGDGVAGQLLIKTTPGAIILPPGKTPSASVSGAGIEPQLRGALIAIGTDTIDGDNRGGLDNIYRIKFDKNRRLLEAIQRLKVVRAVVAAEPNAVPQLNYMPSDPYNVEDPDSWSRASSWDYPQTRLNEAWNIYQGSGDVRIAIIDTGVANHEDLNARRWETGLDDDFDINWDEPEGPDHGTKVASVCCAAWNGRGAAGVDGHATFTSYVARSLWEVKDELYDAVDDEMDIVNMSFSYPQLGTLNRDVLWTAINWAYAYGIILIASVDNAAGGCNESNYPAEFSEVLSVNNYQNPDKCGWTWANNGIMAPGGAPFYNEVPLATFSNLAGNLGSGEPPYTEGYGTSYAAPFVAGAAALIKGWNPSLTDYQIKTALTSTARNDPGPYNGGIIDVYSALMYAARLNVGQLDWEEAFNDSFAKAPVKAMSIGHGWQSFSVSIQNRGDGILSYEVDIGTLCGLFGTTCFQSDFNDYVGTSKAHYYNEGYQAASQAQYFGYLSPEESVSLPIYVDTEGWDNDDELTTIICVYKTSQEDVKYQPTGKPDPLSCVLYTVRMVECFTSVALQHTELASQIEVLRKFRDSSVKPKVRGGELIAKYYNVSPSIVGAMTKDQGAKQSYIDLVRRFKDTLGAQLVSDATPWLLTGEMQAELEKPFLQDDANALKEFADRLANDPSISDDLADLLPKAKVFVDLNVGNTRTQVLQNLLDQGL